MTKAQMERIVREWQRRLGLERWDLDVAWDPALEGSDASTWRSDSYDRATLRFDPEWASWDVEFTNRIVAHELLHLLTRDVDVVVKDAQDQMHRDAGTLIERRYLHEIEGFVDRIAYRLVEIGGCA